jgi:hypothetical protein
MQSMVAGAIFDVVLAALLSALAMTSRLTKRSVALSIVGALIRALSPVTLSPSVGELPLSMIATAARVALTNDMDTRYIPAVENWRIPQPRQPAEHAGDERDCQDC